MASVSATAVIMPRPFALKPSFQVARKVMFTIPNAMSIQVVIEVSVFLIMILFAGSQ